MCTVCTHVCVCVYIWIIKDDISANIKGCLFGNTLQFPLNTFVNSNECVQCVFISVLRKHWAVFPRWQECFDWIRYSLSVSVFVSHRHHGLDLGVVRGEERTDHRSHGLHGEGAGGEAAALLSRRQRPLHPRPAQRRSVHVRARPGHDEVQGERVWFILRPSHYNLERKTENSF